MKNSFSGLIFLSIVWLSSCGGAANPEKTPDSIVTSTGTINQAKTNSEVATENITTTPSTENVTVIQLTKAMFLEKVYDFEKSPKHWTFIGDKPCVIDFYADWCRPCKMVSPIMAELAEKYKGQITVYKVNTDQERELAQFFGIRSIPTLFFCPAKGDPQMTQGALPKETYEKIITEVLLQKK
jgi:thioredoxin